MKIIRNCPPGKEFLFKLPNGTVVGKAKNISEFTDIIKILPLPSLIYHTEGRHFSAWLEMVGEKTAATALRSMPINHATIRISVLRALKG
ncbi:hypothetical protein COV61_02325 [Candidatus Micrarchaeota archaeon CG11_big_fil_rev_8_21_14_0_20_47_5]|nr:MAG: hypothetical protein AUJ17_02765 [Candidatus Micrarchaeota archaeon CG1_02_47_40]PIN83718.1 MAG: hypothetical protein COV61_02325 [Candidatus Micrarchaeota archaeon CG11_big_fil_rev_8_21_14_0_20_47_5]